MRVLRVLCLHGYHGSARILRAQMAPLVSCFGDAEFVVLDAPSLAVGDFGWWHHPSRGWDRTRAWASELFATQPRFDGVFGFSQGAAFAGLLAGMREEPGEAATAIDLDFAVLVGGFKNDAPAHAQLYRRRFTLPSVHIIGRTDGVIPPANSQELADQFENPTVLHHAGGHVVPGDATVVDGLRRFIESHRSRQVHDGTGTRGLG
jgi:pimeloyl-ACP methyl ester carboxylesterase